MPKFKLSQCFIISQVSLFASHDRVGGTRFARGFARDPGYKLALPIAILVSGDHRQATYTTEWFACIWGAYPLMACRPSVVSPWCNMQLEALTPMPRPTMLYVYLAN